MENFLIAKRVLESSKRERERERERMELPGMF